MVATIIFAAFFIVFPFFTWIEKKNQPLNEGSRGPTGTLPFLVKGLWKLPKQAFIPLRESAHR
jgi:hypothetical protein